MTATKAWTPTARDLGQFFIYQGFNSDRRNDDTSCASNLTSRETIEPVIEVCYRSGVPPAHRPTL